MALRRTQIATPRVRYTVHIYKLRLLAMNGWQGPKEAEFDLANTYMVDEEPGTSAFDIAMARLEASVPVLVDMGLTYEGHLNQKVSLAPLPVANDSFFGPSEFMTAVRGDDVTFLVSPFELPWLNDDVLEYRSAKLEAADEQP